MRLNEQFVLREMAGVTVLVPLNGGFQGIMAVSPVGARILELLREGLTEERKLLDALCGEYDAPRSEIEADLRQFLRNLREERIIIDAPSIDRK